MARITIEDCLKHIDNRFALVHLAIKRVKQLREGAEFLVDAPDNREIVLALREIASEKLLPTQKERAKNDEKKKLEDQPSNETKKIEFDNEEITSEFKELYEKEDLTEREDFETEHDTYNGEEL